MPETSGGCECHVFTATIGMPPSSDSAGDTDVPPSSSIRRRLHHAYTASCVIAEAGRVVGQPGSAVHLLWELALVPPKPAVPASEELSPDEVAARRRRRVARRFARAKNAVIGTLRLQHAEDDAVDVEEAEEETEELPSLQAKLRVAVFCLMDVVLTSCLQSVRSYPWQLFMTLTHLLGCPEASTGTPLRLVGLHVCRTLGFGGLFWGGLLPFAAGNALGALAERAPAIVCKAVTGSTGLVTSGILGVAVRRVCQFLVVYPQLRLDAAFARAVVVDAGCAVVGAAAAGSEIGRASAVLPLQTALPPLLLRLPWNRDEAKLLACVLLHRMAAHRSSGTQRDVVAWALMRRLLPPSHPLAESRGFDASIAATPLYLPRLVLVPLYRLRTHHATQTESRCPSRPVPRQPPQTGPSYPKPPIKRPWAESQPLRSHGRRAMDRTTHPSCCLPLCDAQRCPTSAGSLSRTAAA